MTSYYYIIILSLFHLLGDFFFQPSRLAELKNQLYRGVLAHICILILLAFLFWVFFSFDTTLLILLSSDIILHFIIDTAKYVLIKKYEKLCENPWLYISDQALHVISLFALVFIFRFLIMVSPANILNINPLAFSYLLVMFLLWKPANISFKTVFGKYKPTPSENLEEMSEKNQEKQHVNSGEVIGSLERTLLALSCFTGSLDSAAVGISIVLAFKTLTRFKKIENDKKFSEYYLIGTLFSVVYAIGSFLVVFIVLPYLLTGTAHL